MLTVIIPAAPYHEAIVEQAIASVRQQTVPCECVVVYDHERRGAGWARNQGLEQVTTEFVTFLDADDLLEPTFAEDTLRAFDGTRYVFTDWFTDKVIEAPRRPWSGDGSAHIVTTLLPTAWVRAVGGFDEALPGGEDTDFYWKLTRNGCCGRRLSKPLVQYRKGGQRAKAFLSSPDYENMMRAVVERYERLPMACGDCGEIVDAPPLQPSNAPEPGDVLVMALWGGNRSETGRMTGRRYPRTGNGNRLWVAALDADATPHLFRRVAATPQADADHLAFVRAVRQTVSRGVRTPAQAFKPNAALPAAQTNQRKLHEALELYRQN